jgi:two-component system chemotaxis sensor kinase CheA
MDDLISEFLTETNESLEALDLDLVNLEQNPNDKDLLSKIFRLMHTIKGTCGFLGLPRLEKVAHHAENVLGRFRDGDLEVTEDYVTLIFESIDAIKFIVSDIAEKGAEPAGSDAALIEKLDAVFEGRSETGAEQAQPAERTEAPEAMETPAPQPAPRAEPESKTAEVKTENAAVTAQTLRVNVDVLENLMTMVSELVLTRNQLLQILRMQSESDFTAPLQRLNLVVSDLQEGVVKTRMQPIGNAWAKLPRIIRDLALELGKKIDLEMRGQDTELDRQVLELIKDPLTHMVRNSGDHGIEDPQTRKMLGKPETGKILLNAYHEGGHIIVEISDDGKGLSGEKIKQKVLEKGLATPEELAAMTPQQVQQFIFRAGFSTAEKVTAVSGRGVGMDVVRTNIEKIGGSIELSSREGKGSTFIIKIPLTLAIVSALIVEAAGERFAIPQLAVRELVMTSESGDNRIEDINGTPVLRLRNHLLPLVSLSTLLRLERPESGDEHPHSYVVVTQVGSYDFGIIVDRVFDTEEIVVKPVASILRAIDLFSGNTILGDGSVIMILDPNGIARASGQIDSTEKVEGAEQEAPTLADSERKTAMLLFSTGGGAPKAVPLSLVARLENIRLSSIERSGDQMMVQYRGELMPLLTLHSAQPNAEDGTKPVLVFTDRSRSMGLLVDTIIDITEEHIDVQIAGQQKGIIGSAIIEGKATDVLDVGYFLGNLDQNWFKNHGDEPFGTNGASMPGQKNRVLLVDDSQFFRNMLTPLLSVAGYEVTTLESPLEALKMCERGLQFDIILSDIEMPGMNGFEFAEKVKSGESIWHDTPMVALSSHATAQDISRGLAVGYSKYIAKFDRETLLRTLAQTLSERNTTGQAA